MTAYNKPSKGNSLEEEGKEEEEEGVRSRRRRLEEEEFRQGTGKLTEVWEDQAKQQSRQELERRRAKQGLEEELKALVTAGIGASSWEDIETPPKKAPKRSQTPPVEKWDCNLEEEEEEEEDWVPPPGIRTAMSSRGMT